MKDRKRPFKKSIGIVGEGLTERLYFDYIRSSRRYTFSLKPDLPRHTDYIHIFRKAKQLLKDGFDLVFCVLDIDAILKDGMIDKFTNECRKLPKRIIPITSNPCIEFWFLLHFLDTPKSRVYESCQSLIDGNLQKYAPKYEKTEAYFRNSQLFSHLEQPDCLEKAMANSMQILKKLQDGGDPSLCSFSEVSILFNQLEKCKECNFVSDCKNCSMTISTFFSSNK